MTEVTHDGLDAPGLEELSVAIVAWNCGPELSQCLRSLRLASPEATVYVIDNASTDGTADMVRREFAWARLIANSENIGFGPANNLALRQMTTQYGLVLNPDTVVTRDALIACFRYSEVNARVGLVGCTVVGEDGVPKRGNIRRLPTVRSRAQEELFPRRLFKSTPEALPTAPTDVEAVPGAFMWLRLRAGREIGFFDDELFLYSEDTDLCHRLRLARWRVVYLPNARIIHAGGHSSAKAAGRSLFHYYRSEDYYFRKHYGRLHVAGYRTIVMVGCALRLLALVAKREAGAGSAAGVYRRVLRGYSDGFVRGQIFRHRELLSKDFDDTRS